MNKKSLNSEINLLTGVIIFSFSLRIISAYFFRDAFIENEWNILLNNLINHKSYSFYSFNNQLLPSAYMPPLYPFLLYFLKTVSFLNDTNFLYLIIFIQIVLSTYSVYLFYQINQSFFSNKLSIINSIIFSIIPLNIYSCGQISSIGLQIFLSLLFLKFSLLLINKEKPRNVIFLSIISGLLILTRGEFILIFFLMLIFTFFYKKLETSNVIKILIIVSLIISPYAIRNYIHFNQIFIVKSFGYNLWKGNNPVSKVEGYENFKNDEFVKLEKKIEELKKNSFYEVNRDNIFLNEAFDNLRNNPVRYIQLFFKKLFSYYFIDFNSDYPNYYNFLHIFPILLVSIISFPGLFIFYKKNKLENNYLSLYLLLNLIIFSIFFILPRYKLIILPVQIILAANFVVYVMRKYGFK